jgi:hypothetical protein
MADVSDIEDGFTLKGRREKAPTGGKKRRPAPLSEHTLPPAPAKHILASFTLANPTSKRAVSDYVETQARGEKVRHAEKVKSEHLFDREYDCWDVHTTNTATGSSRRPQISIRNGISRASISRSLST